MNHAILIFFAAIAGIASSCAPIPKINTISGKPQIIINRDMATVKNKISSDFVMHGNTILNETSRSIRFAADMNTGNAMLYKVAMGNSYSSDPSLQYDFNFISQGKNRTLVSGRVITVMQNAFGRSQNTDLSKGKAGVELQNYFVQAKKKLEK